MARTRDQHLFDDGPKRILALDGGGIRGALSLGYLSRMESMLRARNGNDPDFRLCDYFDLIGGTSTGSIIATGLALGFSTDKLIEIYRTLGEQVFEASFLRFGVFGSTARNHGWSLGVGQGIVSHVAPPSRVLAMPRLLSEA